MPNLCLYCSCSYDYFCEKGRKFHLFEPWNLFAKLSWAHVYTVYVPMIILVKRGQKSLLRLPHLWEFLNLLAKFSRTYVSAIFIQIAWEARGVLTPKFLLRHSQIWEQLNIFVKLSRTHVSLVYVPMIIVFERGAKMTPPV